LTDLLQVAKKVCLFVILDERAVPLEHGKAGRVQCVLDPMQDGCGVGQKAPDSLAICLAALVDEAPALLPDRRHDGDDGDCIRRNYRYDVPRIHALRVGRSFAVTDLGAVVVALCRSAKYSGCQQNRPKQLMQRQAFVVIQVLRLAVRGYDNWDRRKQITAGRGLLVVAMRAICA
jgi:hypothetical protein